ISGPGNRVVFVSTGDNPILGMTGGNNPSTSRNEEVFFSDIDPTTGAPIGTKRQITTTTPTSAGGVVNIVDLGHRMSRYWRIIAFDSYVLHVEDNTGGARFTSFATYRYDTTIPPTLPTAPYRRIGPRSDADSAATGVDVQRYPGFTDTAPVTGVPSTFVLETR